MYRGIWGTICDDGWDDADTTVVCRQLGLFNGYTTRQDQFGSSSGPVWIRQVNCSGNESKLSYCIHSGTGNIGSCSHVQDVAVQCNSYGKYISTLLHVHMYTWAYNYLTESAKLGIGCAKLNT